MAPWVFVASNNDELKEWMKVLTVAASAGKESSTQATKSEEKTPVCHKAPAMQAIVEEEEEESEEQLISCSLQSDAKHASTQLQNNSSRLNKVKILNCYKAKWMLKFSKVKLNILRTY